MARRMAIAQNIPIHIHENKEPIIKSEITKMEYIQWRLLFYIDKIIVFFDIVISK